MTENNINKRISRLEHRLSSLESEIESLREQLDRDIRKPASVSPAPQTPGGADNQRRGLKSWWRRIGWWTFVKRAGILAGIGYAVITLFQWRDLRHNFQSTQRSWIKVDTLWPPNAPDAGHIFAVQITNTGRAVVLNAEISVWVKVVGADEAPPIEERSQHSVITLDALFPRDRPVRQDVAMVDGVTGEQISLTSAQVKSLSEGKSYMVMYGVASYQDEFGFHWTRYCQWRYWLPPGEKEAPFMSAPCVRYNAVGDGKYSASDR